MRTTAIHPWHVAHGAEFENVGQWKRPWYYPRPGEDMDAAVARECRAARTGVAIMDGSTLGKIDVQGPDAGEFLDRLYTNLMTTLKVGSIRYGVMCGPDGMVHRRRHRHPRRPSDRLPGHHHHRQRGRRPGLDGGVAADRVAASCASRCTSVTEQWATVALVGPRSREVLAALAPDLDVVERRLPAS